MKLIDLSRALYHRTPTLPNRPPVVMTEFGIHADVGKGRLRFIGFPLKIRGGSGSPISPVAVLDE